METTMNNVHPDRAVPADAVRQNSAASRPSPPLRRSGDDVVRWAEFRLALWMGGIALTVILSGFGFLYTAITDLRAEIRTEMQAQRVEMQADHAALRSDMEADHAAIRSEMEAEHAAIRSDMDDLGTEVDDLATEVDDLRNDVIDVRERVIRIETRLDTALSPPAGDA